MFATHGNGRHLKLEQPPNYNTTNRSSYHSEFDAMRELRHYFQNDKQVPRELIYISSYWKSGVSEDGHKAFKQQDAQQSSK